MKNCGIKEFVAYEYLSFDVKSELEPLYIDCYQNFGWLPISSPSFTDKEDYYLNHYDIHNDRVVTIRFKRDRRIKNKAKLLLLQKKVELTLKEIEKLEERQKSVGVVWALGIGLIGTFFLVMAVLVIIAENPLYIVGTLYGIIGIVGWILPYFVYQKVKLKKEKESVLLLEELYNTVYDSCEQARNLID